MGTKSISSCRNCNSESRKIKSRGCCYKCYPLLLRLERIKKWDIDKPETLKDYPKYPNYIYDKEARKKAEENYFNKIKTNWISQLQGRLDWLKNREERLNSDVSGIEIEYGFNRIAHGYGVKDKNLFHGYANIFDHNFDCDQKRILFNIIDTIEQSVAWPTLNIWGN